MNPSHRNTLFSCLAMLVMLGLAAGSIDSDPATDSSSIDGAWISGQDFAKAHLKSPSSAKFGKLFEQSAVHNVEDLGDGRYRVEAFVDAQNEFGAMVRVNFVCDLAYTGNGYYRCESFRFQE